MEYGRTEWAGGGGKRGKLRRLEGLTLNNWAGEVFFVQ